MPEFINEFTIANQVKELQLFTIGFDSKLAAQKRFGYKVASQTARKLTFELNTPVASMGEMLVGFARAESAKDCDHDYENRRDTDRSGGID